MSIFSSYKKIFLLGFIIVILVAIPFSVYIAQQRQKITSKAAASTVLSFEPASSTVKVGDTLTLNIMLDPGAKSPTNQVSFAKLSISFDPSKFTTITKTTTDESLMPNTVGNTMTTIVADPKYDNTAGKVSMSLSIGADPTKAVTTKTKIATLQLKAIAETTPTSPNITFDITSNNTQVLSIASSDQTSENVLSTTVPATVTVTSAVTSPTPTPNPSNAIGNDLDITFGHNPPNSYYNGDTVHYVINVINPVADAPIITGTATNVVIKFFKPEADGLPNLTGTPWFTDTIADFPPGSTKTYDSTTNPELAVKLALSPGVTVARAEATYIGAIRWPIGSVGDAHGRKDITVGILSTTATPTPNPSCANTNNLNMILGVLPQSAHNGDVVHYFINVIDPLTEAPYITADATNITVMFAKPQADGTPGTPVLIDTIASLPAGNTKAYDYTTTPALAVTLALNPGVTVAHAEATYASTVLVCPPAEAHGRMNISVSSVSTLTPPPTLTPAPTPTPTPTPSPTPTSSPSTSSKTSSSTTQTNTSTSTSTSGGGLPSQQSSQSNPMTIIAQQPPSQPLPPTGDGKIMFGLGALGVIFTIIGGALLLL